VVTGRLVGRDAALDTARVALTDAFAGAGQLLLVSGEPGIGKTALMAELAAEAAARGARVLRGVCTDHAGAPAYWPWAQVMRAAALGMDRADLGEAARLVDRPADVREPAEAATRDDDAAQAAADARFRLFEAVTAVLSRLADSGPLVVAVDDAQWADPPSLRLLDFVVRHLAAQPVLLLVAYRDTDLRSGAAVALGGGQLLTLGGLDPPDVATLIRRVTGAEPPPELVEQISRRSGGNPFFVRELARLLVAQGGLGARRILGIPQTVRDTLDRRLARLSQPCADLLAVAALVGRRVRPEVLARAVPAPEEPVPALLDEAVRAQVLVGSPHPADGLGFAHDLFRETIAAGVPPARRATLHERIGRALADLRDAGSAVPAGEIAAHLLDSGSPDVAADAVRYSAAAAAEATALVGHEEACRHYERALRALDLLNGFAGSDLPSRRELLLGLAGASERAGDSDRARTSYRQVAELARRDGDGIGLARAALGVRGLGARSDVSYAETIGMLTDAADALPETEPMLVRVLAGLAVSLRHSGAPNEQVEATATRAVRLAREQRAADGQADQPASGTVSSATLAASLHALHDAQWRPGNAERRLATVEEMRAAAELAGDPELVAQSHLLVAAALIELGRPGGLTELGTYIRLANGLGHARGRWGALSRRATLAAVTGPRSAAEGLAASAAELGTTMGEPEAGAVYATLCCSLIALGSDGSALADFSVDVSDPVRPLMPALRALGMLGAGDTEAARTELTGFPVDALPANTDLELEALVAQPIAAVGSTEQREALLARMAPYAGTHVLVSGCASYAGAVDHHLGMLCAALGRTEEAARHHAAALAMHERLGALPWAELSRAQLERLAEARGDETVFRHDGTAWTLAYAGRLVHLPDAKGLRDLAALLGSPGRPVHVFTLIGREDAPTGADPVLDEPARLAYKARLAELEDEISEADSWRDLRRAERARTERDALVRELTAATGLGGRSRRLGDETERARKTVTARVKDTLRRIERVHPELGAHLRTAVTTGTTCLYAPAEPPKWRL
jgi:hypothetical protein